MSAANPSSHSVLTGKQRRHLRALAHHIDPVVQVGKGGMTDALTDAVDRALTDHELVKVRVLEGAPQDRHELARPLAHALRAHVVGTVGRIVILYRQRHKNPEIVLPSASLGASASR
jgi:RNA-binding protein